MPKRKKAPTRLLNHGENWSFVATNVDISENNGDDTEERPNKILKTFHNKISKTIIRCNVKNEKYFLGQFFLGTTNNIFPQNWKKCKIQSLNDTLKLDFDKESHCIVKLTENVKVILGKLKLLLCIYY